MPKPQLDGFPVSLSIPVQWGEMDAYGHVNNAVFFRYFESARIAYLERSGFARSMERERIGAILHSTFCRFRAPLRYPDVVEVGGRCSKLEDDRFTMEYLVVSRNHDAVAAEGWGVIVSFDYAAGKKTAIPGAVREAIIGLEGGDPGRGGSSG
ncbi:MAG: acyl-CoA thioesterase [Gemmatimonadales bacterium]